MSKIIKYLTVLLLVISFIHQLVIHPPSSGHIISISSCLQDGQIPCQLVYDSNHPLGYYPFKDQSVFVYYFGQFPYLLGMSSQLSLIISLLVTIALFCIAIKQITNKSARDTIVILSTSLLFLVVTPISAIVVIILNVICHRRFVPLLFALSLTFFYLSTPLLKLQDPITKEDNINAPQNVIITNFQKRTNYWHLNAIVNGNDQAQITIPVAMASQWKILLDDQNIYNKTPNQNPITINIPPGNHDLTAYYIFPLKQQAFNAISLGGLLAFVVFFVLLPSTRVTLSSPQKKQYQKRLLKVSHRKKS